MPDGNLSIWDIGGCNCCGLDCVPCALPTSDLAFAATGPLVGAEQDGTLSFSLGLGDCYWQGGFVGIGGINYLITISCYTTETIFDLYNESTLVHTALNVCSYTCDPLNIVLKIHCTGANSLTVTITP